MMTSRTSRTRAHARPRCGSPAPWTRVCLAAACLALASAPALAAPAAPAPGALTGPPIRAVRITGGITIDGALTEPVWQGDHPCTTPVQRIPLAGASATQRTEVRVAYDDRAIYIGARLYDPAPASIAGRLGRRDAAVA